MKKKKKSNGYIELSGINVPKEIKFEVTQQIIDQVTESHRKQCGPGCQHNLAAEMIAVALKAKGFADVVVDTGTLPSGRRTIVRIP
jgi:hypothetical protein